MELSVGQQFVGSHACHFAHSKILGFPKQLGPPFAGSDKKDPSIFLYNLNISTIFGQQA